MVYAPVQFTARSSTFTTLGHFARIDGHFGLATDKLAGNTDNQYHTGSSSGVNLVVSYQEGG
jgi:hypothetical protein